MKITNICLKGATFALVAAFTNSALACGHSNCGVGGVLYPQPAPIAAPAPMPSQMPEQAPAQMPMPAPEMPKQAPEYGQAPIAPVAAPVAAPGGIRGFLGIGCQRNYRCSVEANHTKQFVLVKARSHHEARAAAIQAYTQIAGAGANCGQAHVHCHD